MAFKSEFSSDLNVIALLFITAIITFSAKIEPVLNIKRRARTLFII